MKLELIVLFVTTVELIRTNILSINEMTNKGFMNNNNNKVKKMFFLLSILRYLNALVTRERTELG